MVIAAILLAAHDATIDGIAVARLPWHNDETLIEYEIAQLQAAGANVVVVVLGYEAERIIPLVARDGVEPIVNERWRDGAAGSMRVGASAVPRDTEAAIIASVDEPRPAAVYRQLLNESRRAGAQITRASCNSLAGAPIIVGRAVLAELRNVTDEGGAEAVWARHAAEVASVAFDAGVLLRIASSADYGRARAQSAVD